MKQKYIALPFFIVAFLILMVSVYKTASVKYAFSQAPSPAPVTQKAVNVDYALPEPGITPENPLWPVMALVDKANASPESYLESADVRLVAGRRMVEEGKVAEGYVVFEKAEQYLKESYEMSMEAVNINTRNEFLMKISRASLKHREVLETILSTAPDDGRAVVTKILDTPKMIYENSSLILQNSGLIPPTYPF